MADDEKKVETLVAKLQEKEDYTSYQEDLSFAKELNILRNDFYYQMINSDGITLVDFLYHPLDIMSGDSYSARIVDNDTTFYLVVDGMGKGLSASLTTMIMTSFINYFVDKMLKADNFNLNLLILESIEFIRPILLPEESLSIDYIVINNRENLLYYSKFAMPSTLMENSKNKIVKIKSNNPPLSKWQEGFLLDSIDISDIGKFLIYSDGLVENTTKYEDKVYIDFIEKDFLNSFTREDFKDSFLEKIKHQEDDITLIYIHRLNQTSVKLANKTFSSTLQEIDSANSWYMSLWEEITPDKKILSSINLVFTELYMNAYEHGNLGIDAGSKHILIENDEYFDTLLEKEKKTNKKISVKVDRVKHNSYSYIITQITDEGDGFDTQLLSEIFRSSQTFNGRGVFISRKNSLGIYYNSKGNSVLFLNKVSKS